MRIHCSNIYKHGWRASSLLTLSVMKVVRENLITPASPRPSLVFSSWRAPWPRPRDGALLKSVQSHSLPPNEIICGWFPLHAFIDRARRGSIETLLSRPLFVPDSLSSPRRPTGRYFPFTASHLPPAAAAAAAAGDKTPGLLCGQQLARPARREFSPLRNKSVRAPAERSTVRSSASRDGPGEAYGRPIALHRVSRRIKTW